MKMLYDVFYIGISGLFSRSRIFSCSYRYVIIWNYCRGRSVRQWSWYTLIFYFFLSCWYLTSLYTGADTAANDGIYSRYFTEFSGDGRYTVQLAASNPTRVTRSASSTTSTTAYQGLGANYNYGYITGDGK